jgi:hypothetical protein
MDQWILQPFWIMMKNIPALLPGIKPLILVHIPELYGVIIDSTKYISV